MRNAWRSRARSVRRPSAGSAQLALPWRERDGSRSRRGGAGRRRWRQGTRWLGQKHRASFACPRAWPHAGAVDGLVVGGGGQPAPGLGGTPSTGRDCGGRERLCGHVLGDVEVTERLARMATTGPVHRGARVIAARTSISLTGTAEPRPSGTAPSRSSPVGVWPPLPAGSHRCYERRRLDPTRSAEIASRISTRMTSYSASDRYPH